MKLKENKINIEKPIKPISKMVFLENKGSFLCKFGWHKPIRKIFYNEQVHADCERCEKELIQDSQGGWF